MIGFRQLASLFVLSSVVAALFSGGASACDLCRRYALSAPHVEPIGAAEPIGGDALDDAMTDPADHYPNEGGSASFVLQGGKWPQPGGPGTSVTLTYSFQNMFDGGLKMPGGQPLPNSLIRRSIEEAMGLWASVAPLHFVEVPDNGLAYGMVGAQYGQIRFRHRYINGRDPTYGAPAAKAQAYFPNSAEPNRGDVEFDHDDLWQEVGTLRQPDILGATIHELGHSLGLGHSSGTLPGEFWTYQQLDGTGQIVDVMEPKGDANMYWIFTRYSGLGTGMLFADDIAGIQAIYGAGSGVVVSLVPEPAIGVLLSCATIAWVLRRRRGRDGRAI